MSRAATPALTGSPENNRSGAISSTRWFGGRFKKPWAKEGGVWFGDRESGVEEERLLFFLGHRRTRSRLQPRAPAVLTQPSEHRLYQRAVGLVLGKIAQPLDADETFVDDQPVEDLLQKARLFTADLEGQQQ